MTGGEIVAYAIVRSSSGTEETANKCEALIESANDLTNLPEDLAPGSVAYKADMSLMYMKDLDGSWKQIGG